MMNAVYFLMLRQFPHHVSAATKRRERASIRCEKQDPIATSLRDHKWKDFWLRGRDPWRRMWNNEDCWESWREYTIMPDCGWSDADIQHSVDELEVTTGSAFDCSGKPFSRFIHWKRTKAGVVIIRHMSIDI